MATVFKFPLVMTLNRKGLHRDEPGAARLVTETTIEDALKRARRWRQSGSTRTRGGLLRGGTEPRVQDPLRAWSCRRDHRVAKATPPRVSGAAAGRLHRKWLNPTTGKSTVLLTGVQGPQAGHPSCRVGTAASTGATSCLMVARQAALICPSLRERADTAAVSNLASPARP